MRPSKRAFIIASILKYLGTIFLVVACLTILGIIMIPSNSTLFIEHPPILRAFLFGLVASGMIGIALFIAIVFIGIVMWVEDTITGYHKYAYTEGEEEDA